MIKADILLDSINGCGCRITTFELTYPRFIHSELLTHRMFSRNSASSRAIPIEKVIDNIVSNPVMPLVWGKNQKGMQADEVLSGWEQEEAEAIVRMMIGSQKHFVRMLMKLNVHKQISNRYLEPFVHMTTILTATDFGNFFNLRAHKDAQPEFQELAFQMLVASEESKPNLLAQEQWHIPFGDKMPEGLDDEHKLMIATARCARISYMTHDGEMNIDKDYAIFEKLRDSGHWSAFEHCSQNMENFTRYGNFKGWKQYRKTFNNENRVDYNAETLLNARRKYATK